MKYKVNVYALQESEFTSITTTFDNADFTNFPAEVGNPSYDAFLIQVDLTDEEVHALPVDEWIEA